ncbi:MAG: hypothetical protein QXO15_02645 [Nitrososphaerota archaeon]
MDGSAMTKPNLLREDCAAYFEDASRLLRETKDFVETDKLVLRKVPVEGVGKRLEVFLTIKSLDEDKYFGNVRLGSIEGELSYRKLLLFSRKVKRFINQIKPIHGVPPYKLLVLGDKNYIMNIVKDALENGVAYLAVGKVPVSNAEILLAEEFRKMGLDFLWKERRGQWLFDFYFKRRKVLIKIVDCEKMSQEELKNLFRETHRLKSRGYLVYWIDSRELSRNRVGLAKLIGRIVYGKEIWAPGWITTNYMEKVSEESRELVIKLRTVNIGDKILKYAELFLQKQETYNKIGEIRVTKNVRRFAQKIVGILTVAHYYYSFRIEDYMKIYNELINNGEVTIIVKKLHK